MKSRLGLLCFVLSILFLVCLVGARYVLGGWVQLLWVPLGGFVACLGLSLFFSWKRWVSFLRFRSTRFGLSMGRLFLLFFMGLVVINYSAYKSTLTWDLSRDRINSLAPQTISVLKGIKENIEILVFHKGPQDKGKLEHLRTLLELYTSRNKKLSYQFVNIYENPKKAQKYINQKEFDSKGINAYLVKKERLIKIDYPVNEEKVTQSIVKMGRSVVKKIYLSEGHGEKHSQPGDNDPKSISKLVEALRGYSFSVESLHLEKTEFVPFDANLLVIAGPEVPFSLKAVEKVKSFLAKGGKVLFMLDPGPAAQAWDLFLKDLGIEYKNNYVLDPTSSLGQTIVITEYYDSEHLITERFQNRSTAFSYVSSLELNSAEKWLTRPLVTSPQESYAVDSLTSDWKASDRGYKVIGTVSDSLTSKGSLVFFSDSDFAADQLLYAFSNRDLVLNSIAYLTKDEDLVSIKPNSLSSQSLNLTRMEILFLIAFSVLIPLMLLIAGGYFWALKRRRG